MLNSKLPPRQKMINLMYIIFIAIVSISISNSVIDGYGEVYKKELIANEQLAKVTQERYEAVVDLIGSAQSPIVESVKESVVSVNRDAENIIATIVAIRENIARYVDGKGYKEDEIHNFKENSDIIALISEECGKELYQQLTAYKELLISSGLSNEQSDVMDRYLYQPSHQLYDEWEKGIFNGGSVINTMSLLNGIESGVLLCEDLLYVEVYTSVLSAISEDTAKMTEDNAEMDSLNRKKDYIIAALSIEKPRVSTKAMVVSKMDNKLYCGVETQLDLLVNGDDGDDIVVQTNNGTISSRDGAWFVKPLDGARDAKITVKRVAEEKEYNLATYTYHVKYLPDPRPILSYQNVDRKDVVYRGYTSIRKEDLIRDVTIGAELRDFEIDVAFKVISFELICTSNGKVTIFESKGDKFTSEQKRAILALKDQDRLHITSIVVVGSDGVERTISSLDIVLI